MEVTSETGSPSKVADKIEFKKPVLVGRVGKLPKKAKSGTEHVEEQKKEEKTSSEDGVDSIKHKSNLPPAVLIKELSTPIPYKEPKWSGLCPDGSEYGLEVIKSGMILEKIDLTQKSYFVFGRLANCDVVMSHPTISRHHAVLQYKAFASDTEPPPGWYLYDLGSTHGTTLNKQRIKPNHYTRVRVGHQIKFGNSTRMYILLGPDFDCEGESDLTVTEIKLKAQNMKLERDRMIKEAMEQRERDRLEEEKRREERGIDWGMGEDADEEQDLSENPYASTANEELYLQDPKKTLRGYFEREGHELSYDCEERGTGQFLCKVELPIDDPHGRPITAEVLHRGKKKEAVIACALEACNILDRAGLLRQAKHESRRRKAKDYSQDDYYDSDDDSYLDRTGHVEARRNMRKMRHTGESDKDSDRARSYDDLLKQASELESKIATEEKNLESLRSQSRHSEECASEMDALDEYMTSLGRQGQTMAQKAEISKARMSIQKLKSELSKTQRLAEIARPAHLPPLLKKGSSLSVKVGSNSVIYGKRLILKDDKLKQRKERKVTKREEEEEFVEEVDSDEEMDAGTKEMKSDTSAKETSDNDKVQGKSDNMDVDGVNTSGRSCGGDSKDDWKHGDDSKNDRKHGDDSKNDRKHGDDSKNDRKHGDDSKNDSNNEEDSKNDSKREKQKDDDINSGSKRIFGPMRPPENYVIPENYFDQETDRDLPEIEEKDDL